MQDKIKELLKKISFFTTDPDKDWKRLFVMIVLLSVGVFVWSIYFYMQVEKNLLNSTSTERKIIGGVVLENEDNLKKMIGEFETKKQNNEDLIKGIHQPSLLDLSDPAR